MVINEYLESLFNDFSIHKPFRYAIHSFTIYTAPAWLFRITMPELCFSSLIMRKLLDYTIVHYIYMNTYSSILLGQTKTPIPFENLKGKGVLKNHITRPSCLYFNNPSPCLFQSFREQGE